MTYGFTIDQEFAIINELSLVQVSTLAAFMTLPVWSKTVAIDGAVWYQYSDEKMAKDFPLLFGIAKRCYKNITELADMGFVELTKLGRIKYVRFTSRCADWNKKKEQIRSNSPKTDQEQSENGPVNGPKMDSVIIDYNINHDNITDNKTSGPADAVPAQEQPGSDKGQGAPRGKVSRATSEPLCLFADSRYCDPDKFVAQFNFAGTEYEDVDIMFYYNSVADWSSRKAKKQKDWIATARSFMRRDKQEGKLVRLKRGPILTPEAEAYLNRMM